MALNAPDWTTTNKKREAQSEGNVWAIDLAKDGHEATTLSDKKSQVVALNRNHRQLSLPVVI